MQCKKQTRKMEQHYLPREIIINILSRLPVRTIVSFKLYCKSWRNFLESPEFAMAHLSHSPQGLSIHEDTTQPVYKIFEFNDDFDLKCHDLHYNLVTDYKFHFNGWNRINSSANGLLFLLDMSDENLYICNPLTRDFMKFQCPQRLVFCNKFYAVYGLGSSKRTNQHKLVGIFPDCVYDQEKYKYVATSKCEWHVYTLETGLWRRIDPGAQFLYDSRFSGAFVNGSLHWLVVDGNGCPLISCLDLETELFSTLSPAPITRNVEVIDEEEHLDQGSPDEESLVVLCALGDCLCLCDNTSNDVIIIWKMREYSVESSWTKEFVISKIPGFACYPEFVWPIKIFKDGDILMAWGVKFLFYYSHKNKTTEKIAMFNTGSEFSAVFHTPSFLSLKSFRLENVSSF